MGQIIRELILILGQQPQPLVLFHQQWIRRILSEQVLCHEPRALITQEEILLFGN